MIITTNIRLPQEQWKELKIMAVHAGTSVSALVRLAIGRLLQTRQASSGEATGRKSQIRKDPFYKVIGLGQGGPPDDSTRHDFYLYPQR